MNKESTIHKQYQNVFIRFICISIFAFAFEGSHSFCYTPGSINGKYEFKFLGYVYQSLDGNGSGWNWRSAILSHYGSRENVWQSCIPSAYVDNGGDLYALFLWNIWSRGVDYWYRRISLKNESKALEPSDVWVHIAPWPLIGNFSLKDDPYLETFSGDTTYFKKFIYNIFNPCIAQNVGSDTDYLNCFCYISPTRFQNAEDTEGFLWFKIKKTDGSITKVNYYNGHNQDNLFSFHHQKPRRDSDSHMFQPVMGNYQAWEDAGKVHFNWIGLRLKQDATTAKPRCLYNGSVGMYEWFRENYSGCYSLPYRVIKYGGYVYVIVTGTCTGGCAIHKQDSNALNHLTGISWATDPFRSMYHTTSDTPYAAQDYDFCILDNPDNPAKPVFCVLGLRPTHPTQTGETSLGNQINPYWGSTYINWGTSEIVLILSSCAWDTKNDVWVKQLDAIEDPQNVIYTTGKTSFQDSCSLLCNCYSKSYVGYGEKQLFKNTHKCVVYKAASGAQYLIYCYCYPGKTKQLYLGYARIFVENNKARLLTKCEFRASEEPWRESFGDFRYCSRIVSLDCKNGHVWITWVDDGCRSGDLCQYNCFHILAKDLVGE